MYIDIVPNRGSRPAVLLRVATREGTKIRKQTLANLSHWPAEQVEALRRLLKGETLVAADTLLTIERSLPHGHVQAVLGAIRRLGIERLLAGTPSRLRNLVVAMLAERLLHPGSKLATTRSWLQSSLGSELGVEDAEVEELYQALDWLLARQEHIEQGLAARHLTAGGLALVDVSSSSYEGQHCGLARWGHNRDGEKLPCIVYGLLTDRLGRPVAVDVWPGNTGDPATVPAQVVRLQQRFGIERVVLVGDRGLLTQAQIGTLRSHPGLGWISALRSPAIRALVEHGAIQMSLFEESSLAEISSPDYPGERLVACFNPILAEDRRRTRQELLAVTEQGLARIGAEVGRRTRTPMPASVIGAKVGRLMSQTKMGKHFEVEIADGRLVWHRREAAIAQEAGLDGIYVIRTSEPADALPAPEVVRSYKRLAEVERVFRCAKGLDLRIRPIFLRVDDHVRAHVLLCMLAYYVEWHLRQAWAPLLFEDEYRETERQMRDPVAPAQPSAAARRKKTTRTTTEGFPVHSFQSLLGDLATLCRNRCRLRADLTGSTFDQLTEPTPLQRRALDLVTTVPSA